ncbi:apolipoprotein N-acyltransferase [Pseudocalidococcus azoricus]|uniref:apolipoprotein N-acyltransferase n=1 Tax=Pseudocalidococcus azoricus TaxID=3110322 RepID=UPI002AF6AA8A|nr:apolipoprotein N-acyltransferase [Pseudocalidococcus azoricus]
MSLLKRVWLSGLGQGVTLFFLGLITGLSLPPWGVWGLAWVGLAPVWFIATVKTEYQDIGARFRQGFFAAGCWGLGFYGWGLAWITGLHPLMWMGLSPVQSLAVALGAWVAVTGWGVVLVGAWGGVLAIMTPWRKAWAWELLLGIALWCLLEGIWTRSPLWWTSYALTQSPGNLAILHWGQVSGPNTICALLLLVNGMIAGAWKQLWNHPKPLKLWLLPILGWGIAQGIGWIWLQTPLTPDNQAPLTIGILQGNIPTRIKLTPQGINQALSRYTQGYQALVQQGAEAVLTPEAAIPLVWPNPKLTELTQVVGTENVPLWLGIFMPVTNRNNALTQSLITLTGNTAPYSQFNKIKLVPLGEYIPEFLQGVVSRLSTATSELIPGRLDQQFATPLGPGIIGICFDSAFSYVFRDQAHLGGAWIMTVANNDPYDATMMRQHQAQDILRAIETDRYALRATNTGLSGVTDPHGNTLWLSAYRQEDRYLAHIYRRQTQTLYVRYGDWLTPMLLLCLGGMGLLQRSQSPGSRP